MQLLRSAGPTAFSILLAQLAVPIPASGQAAGPDAVETVPRMHAGVSLALAQPRGEFDDYVNVGGGVYGFFRWNLDERGLAGLRIHAGFLNYGNETQRVCLGAPVGCRIEVDLTTSNNILLLGLGPEIGIPVGAARVYASGSVGLGYFATDSRVGGTGDQEPFATTQNYADGGFAWNTGGGVELSLGRIQQYPVALDFGVSYQGNGRREYLTRGGITDLPDGSIELDVKRSEADFLLWRLGVSVGLHTGGAGR